MKVALHLLVITLFGSVLAEGEPMLEAVSKLDAEGDSGVSGMVSFSQEPGQPVKVEALVAGLTPGKHGFHIHTEGPTEAGCASTGPHYNPTEKPHGGPGNPDRHVGDLGNIEADEEGNATLDITDDMISLSGEHSIIGRAVVIHAKEDDLGTTDPAQMGNAGAKVACGIIELVEESALRLISFGVVSFAMLLTMY